MALSDGSETGSVIRSGLCAQLTADFLLKAFYKFNFIFIAYLGLPKQKKILRHLYGFATKILEFFQLCKLEKKECHL